MSYDEGTTAIYPQRSEIAGTTGLLLSAGTLTGNEVFNRNEDNLGEIKDFMLDTKTGHVCYAVLSSGGFLGMGEKLFAVPWGALVLDTQQKRFVLDIGVDRFKDAPGFDKDQWPDMSDISWANRVHTYYGMSTTASAPVSPPV